MARRSFDYSEADYIKVKFKCGCGEVITSDLLPVKGEFDSNKDFDHIDYQIECKCGKNHCIEISDDLFSSVCEIPSIDDESFIYLHEIPYGYAKRFDNSFEEYFFKFVEIKDLANKIDEQEILNNQLLNEMALVQSISLLDAYANGRFVYLLSTYSEFFDNFRRNSILYKKKSKEEVLEALRYRSFQDLKKTIIPFFRDAFGIVLSENEVLSNAVEIRNNIMHHNGRDSDGYKHVLEKELIINVIEQVKSLVKEISNATDEAVFNLLWDRGVFDKKNK